MEQKFSKLPWFLRLTLVNNAAGQTGFSMYPSDKYTILENLDWCQVPYGSGEYRHLAVNPNGASDDDLLEELAGVIESETHPPSIQELNYLGGQLQRMTGAQRAELGRQLTASPEATITDAINAAHHLLGQELVYDGRSMTDRALLLSEDEPYIRVQVVPWDSEPQEGEEWGVWVDCPAQESDLAAAAEKLEVDSILDMETNEWDGLLAFSLIDLNENIDPSIPFRKIDGLARAMKEHGVLQKLGKYKALLEMKNCVDFTEAAELAGELDQYEYCWQSEFVSRCQIVGLETYWEMVAQDLDFEDTHYGLIRPMGEQKLDQQLRAFRWGELAEGSNSLLKLASRLYDLSGGLCKAGAGPGGVGISTSDGSRVHLILSYDPNPVQDHVIFSKKIKQYEVRVTGCWAESGEPVRQEELEALLDIADPATQKVAEALWGLTQETHTVSTEECNEAFDVLAGWQMREAYGTPDGAPPTKQVAVEEPESGPALYML